MRRGQALRSRKRQRFKRCCSQIGSIIGPGENGQQLEVEFANHCDAKYALALANGTLALELALEAAGIAPGDEVIVTPRTFIASASCVVRLGARPVFADVSFESQNLTPESVEAVLTPKTRAVIAVHHAGWPCDMDGLMALAENMTWSSSKTAPRPMALNTRDGLLAALATLVPFRFARTRS